MREVLLGRFVREHNLRTLKVLESRLGSGVNQKSLNTLRVQIGLSLSPKHRTFDNSIEVSSLLCGLFD